MVVTLLPGKKVKLKVQTGEFPAGSAAKILVFREGFEEEDQAIATLNGKTADDGSVEVEFTFTPEPKDRGKIGLVYRAEVDGKWLKSETAFVQLPDLVKASWSVTKAKAGEEVELNVEAPAVPVKDKVKFEIHQHPGDAVVATLEGSPEGDATVRVKWAPPAIDPADPKPRFDFTAKHESRIAVSHQLLVVHSIRIEIQSDAGAPVPGAVLVVRTLGEDPKKVVADPNGVLLIEDIRPGKVQFSIPGIPDGDLPAPTSAAL